MGYARQKGLEEGTRNTQIAIEKKLKHLGEVLDTPLETVNKEKKLYLSIIVPLESIGILHQTQCDQLPNNQYHPKFQKFVTYCK